LYHYIYRSIHSLVYNALKLIMEISPKLFDEYSNQYKENRQMYIIIYINFWLKSFNILKIMIII